MKISIIVPVYNSEQALCQCVESILAQTYCDIELVLVDDGSTDASPQICDSFVDKRVKVLHKANGGISSARNAGITMATGEWITFCDNDDVVDCHWIERLVNVTNGGRYLSVCAYTREKRNLGIERIIGGIERDKAYPMEDYLRFYQNGLAGFVWNALFFHDIIERYEIRFPERKEQGDINEDLIFQLSYLPYIDGIVYNGYNDYLWQTNETNHSAETTEKWYFEKYREKYLKLRSWIISSGLPQLQLRSLATMMLFHFVWSICNAKSYGRLCQLVNDEIVQECVNMADCSNEPLVIIDAIRNKNVLKLYLFVKGKSILEIRRSLVDCFKSAI